MAWVGWIPACAIVMVLPLGCVILAKLFPTRRARDQGCLVGAVILAAPVVILGVWVMVVALRGR